MSKNKAKGTAWESAIVRYLNDNGGRVERRALSGTADRGDIAGLPNVVIEAKDHGTMTLSVWVEEARVEKINDGADIGLVWHKRRGRSSAGDAYVTMSGADLVELLRAGGWLL